MKKVILAFIIAACFLNVNAQISYDNNNNTFTLSSMRPNKPLLANAAGNLPGTISNTPSCAFVLEYGDGFFSTEIDPRYTYNQPGTTQVVINYSGRYDTIKPPSVFSTLIYPLNYSLVPQHMQSMLGINEFVRLTPIARSINVSDEMLFILTYKVPQNGNVKLSFYYNDQNLNAFNQINNYTQTIAESLNSQGANGTVKRIRTYFNEQAPTMGLSPSTSPISSGTVVYSNAINWNFQIPAPFTNGTERNIFITLRTKDNIAMPACGQVEAVYVHDSATSFSTLDMCAVAKPHDPNFIETSPRCITKGTGTQPVKYHVHFQNEGAGQAYRLNVKVKLDSKLHEAAAKLKWPNSFKIKIGDKPVPAAGYDYVLQPDGIMSFDFPGKSKRSLIRGDSSLSCNKVPIWFSNPLTMGDIEFMLDVPKNEEADLSASADIVFYSGPSPEKDMPVVSTQPDTLFVRTHCSDSLFPQVHPLPPPQIPCLHFLGICWCWWIIIIIAVCILTWYVVKRNKRRKASQYS
jgi:hypothetical protein